MSKIVIGLDTATNELIVNVDGKELKNVSSVSIYKYEIEEEDKVGIDISIMEENEEEGGLKTNTRLWASKGGQGGSPVVNQQISDYIRNRN